MNFRRILRNSDVIARELSLNYCMKWESISKYVAIRLTRVWHINSIIWYINHKLKYDINLKISFYVCNWQLIIFSRSLVSLMSIEVGYSTRVIEIILRKNYTLFVIYIYISQIYICILQMKHIIYYERGFEYHFCGMSVF